MRLIFTLFFIISSYLLIGQGCCSGGSGSPIAGGAATGVLQENQMEISFNYQHNRSSKIFDETTLLSENSLLKNDYLFFRTDYGLSKKLTLSLSTGYYLDKSFIDSISENNRVSKGFSDLIIFPKYSLYNKAGNLTRTEIVLGIGVKIPIGKYADSTLAVAAGSIGGVFPEYDIYEINPPTVQPTNGSNDFIFYSFFFREYQKNKIRLFISSLYVRKGFNPLGIKFGDYNSISLFFSKTFLYRFGISTQIKGEKIGSVKAADNIDLLAFYNIDREYTGSRKIFFIPQLSYSIDGLTFFAVAELPLYQHLNGTQFASQHQFTFGLNYRFLVK